MTINDSIEKSGYPSVIFSNSQPTTATQLNGQIWVDDWGGIKFLKNGQWIPISSKESSKSLIYLFSDFLTFSPFSVSSSGTGANAGTTINDPGGRPGIIQMQLGTTNTGSVRASTNNNLILGNNRKWWFDSSIRIPVLSNSTESFVISVGFASVAPTPDSTNMAVIQYCNSVNNGAFTLKTRKNGGTITSIATDINPTANTWYRLSAIINENGDYIDIYIDGVQKAGTNLNIPNASNQVVTAGIFFNKLIGTTSRNCDLDYLEFAGIQLIPNNR